MMTSGIMTILQASAGRSAAGGLRQAGVGKEWFVHIGAHKTATTHLQDTLKLAKVELSAAGIEFIHRDAIRSQRGFCRMKWWQKLPGFKQALMEETRCRLFSQRDHGDSILISEENIMGSVSDLLKFPLYHDLKTGLVSLCSLKGDNNINIYLAIRAFSEIIPSAYAQQARMAKVKPGDFDLIKEQMLNRPLSWAGVVERIVSVFGQDRLGLWTFEDYKRTPEFFLSHLCRGRKTEFMQLPPPASTKSPSAKAIASLEEIPNKLSRQARKAQAEKICLHDDGKEPFLPFSEKEKVILQEIYEEDLANIRKKYSGIFIENQNKDCQNK